MKKNKLKNIKRWQQVLLMLAVVFVFGFIGFNLYGQHKVPVKDTAAEVQTKAISAKKTSARRHSIKKNAEPDARIPAVKNGIAPVISTVPTNKPVVFLGIDDGANKQQFEFSIMKTNNIKASLFLAQRFILDNPSFFNQFSDEGSLIEDHTLDHNVPFSSLTYDQQLHQICGQADYEEHVYGRRPILFRPPGGSYNEDTQRAAAACGMKAVVLWIAKANGGSMQYQVGHVLRPGDIVLMHFRPEFQSDMEAFIAAQDAAGLHTELLEDWLQ